jgi:hypothetical protein
MRPCSRYLELRLAAAMRHPFNAVATALLTQVEIISCCAIGVVHRHVLAGGGMFEDGHRIRTSDICKVENDGLYWALCTVSGSRYVIVTFKRPGGRRSLNDFSKVLTGGFYSTPRRLQ